MTPLFSLEGKVALVTGATSGIGLACAEALAECGARVAIAGLAAGDPEAVAAGLRARGRDAAGIVCDLRDRAQVVAMADACEAALGAPDILVCNAGVALDTGPMTTATDAMFDTMMDIHVRSALHLCNRILPGMAARRDGAVIIMSSLSGLRGNGAIGVYGITKAANAQLARNLAVEWGPHNIRVNAISPGVIETEFARPITADPERARRRLEKTPLRCFGQPFHVAAGVVFLASPGGAFVSGHNLVIDGGTLVSD